MWVFPSVHVPAGALRRGGDACGSAPVAPTLNRPTPRLLPRPPPYAPFRPGLRPTQQAALLREGLPSHPLHKRSPQCW